MKLTFGEQNELLDMLENVPVMQDFAGRFKREEVFLKEAKRQILLGFASPDEIEKIRGLFKQWHGCSSSEEYEKMRKRTEKEAASRERTAREREAAAEADRISAERVELKEPRLSDLAESILARHRKFPTKDFYAGHRLLDRNNFEDLDLAYRELLDAKKVVRGVGREYVHGHPRIPFRLNPNPHNL